jgi:hypothetical protein
MFPCHSLPVFEYPVYVRETPSEGRRHQQHQSLASAGALEIWKDFPANPFRFDDVVRLLLGLPHGLIVCVSAA